MVITLRISLRKCRELYLIEIYFQSIEQHYVTGVHLYHGVIIHLWLIGIALSDMLNIGIGSCGVHLY